MLLVKSLKNFLEKYYFFFYLGVPIKGVPISSCEAWLWCSLQEQNATLVNLPMGKGGTILRLSPEGVNPANGMVLASSLGNTLRL